MVFLLVLPWSAASVDTFFAEGRVEVVAEQFMKACAVVKATIMDNDLFAIKVCVAKWWCDIHNSFVIIAVSLVEYFLDGSDALQEREAKSKEPGVGWTIATASRVYQERPT